MTRTPDIQEQFRQAILDADVSRYRLALLSGVSQSTLSNFVNYKRSLTLDKAAMLATVLGLELRPAGKAGRKIKKGR